MENSIENARRILKVLQDQQQVFFIGMDDLIASKQMSNLSQDRVDLEMLQEVLNRKNL